MKKSVMSAMGFFIVCCSLWNLALAEDDHFEITSDAIVEKLLGKEEGPQNRQLTRGWSSALEEKAAPAKTRAIKVVQKKGEEEVWTTVITPEKRQDHYVNLWVNFDVDSYAINQKFFPLLNELGKALSDPRLKDFRIMINGHTDSDGSERYNAILSMKRALSVKKYLVFNFGISSWKLTAFGYGENMPLMPNTTIENKRLNRRVEIVATY